MIMLLGVSIMVHAEDITNCTNLDMEGETYHLTKDVINSAVSPCINILADNIILDCQGHTIDGTDKDNSYGILCQFFDNITVKNCIITDWHRGIYYYSSNGGLIQNVTAYSNQQAGILIGSSSNYNIVDNTLNNNYYGIDVFESSNNNLTNNILNFNFYGIYFYSTCNNNILTKNTAKFNNYGVYPPSQNIFTNNILFHNLKTSMFLISDPINFTSSTGDMINLDLTITYINGTICSNCGYDVTIKPDQIFSVSKTEENLSINFTPSRVGIYSIKVGITDPDDNTEIRKYNFFINATGNYDVTYYYHKDEPAHTQTPGTTDTGSLLLEPVTEEETIYCANWIQDQPDILPNYPLSVLFDVNLSIYYKAGVSPEIGLQRYSTYDKDFDLSQSAATAADYTLGSWTFTDINWGMDYLWNFYWLSTKLSDGIGANPHWKSNPTNQSTATFTLMYATTPAIKYVLDEYNTRILSATMPSSNADNATIILEGRGAINLTVEMPNTMINYDATLDGNTCNNTNCNLISQSNGELNFTMILDSEHTLDIARSAVDVVDITLNHGWNLVSIPLVPENKSAGYLFSVDSAFTFNNSWHEVTELNEILAYWVKVDDDTNIVIEGSGIDEIAYTLNKGWNFISYPSINAGNVANAFNNVSDEINLIYIYRNSLWYSYSFDRAINSLNEINPGEGIIVNLKNDSGWIFSNGYYQKLN